MVAADDFATLNAHIWEVHQDIAKKLCLNLFFDDLCDAGILRRVPSEQK
jgi:hypothetical protein